MITELCKIAQKYGTDKCPQLRHSYTPFYYQLFNDRRQSVKKILEMGIGYLKGMPELLTVYDPGLKRNYHRGASLYMWRDFFPNAQIYGADIHSETIFKDDRIDTFLCDERNKNELTELIKKTGGDLDIFIDDGHHHKRWQLFLCRTLMPILDKSVTYVIEDVRSPQEVASALSQYDCQIVEFSKKYPDDNLVIVKHKP